MIVLQNVLVYFCTTVLQYNLTIAKVVPLYIVPFFFFVSSVTRYLYSEICKFSSVSAALTTFFIKFIQIPTPVVGSCKSPMEQGLSVHPFFHLSFFLGIFLESYCQFFLNFGMQLKIHMKFYVTEVDFLEKNFCPQIWENGLTNRPKAGFLNLLKTFVINFY